MTANSIIRLLAGACAAALLTGAAAESKAPPAELPADLAEKVRSLPAEKLEFLRGEGALAFADRHDLLFSRLSKRTPEAIEAYIDAMMEIDAASKYDPSRDRDSIPLDTKDPTFNDWKMRRPPAFDTPRQPGPINVQRYLSSGPKQGIPTFFNLPVALTPADLVAGEVEVAIMGAGLDMGSGARGAAYGPRAVRTGAIYKSQSLDTPEHMHTMVSPFNELRIVDYGDVAVDDMSTERSMDHIRELVREVATTGAIPVIVGGDHSLMYPDAAGVVDVYGKGNIGVIHFDAHYDAGGSYAGHLISHGQPVRRLFNEELVPGKNFIQVGLRGYWPGREGFEWARKNGLRYHTMAEIERNGWEKTMNRVLMEARDGPEFVFISFDIDVLDPAYAPGTGTPEPGGLTTREAFPVVRRLCAETNVVGFELVEVNPLMDPGYTTAQNADRILRECLTGIAMRKKGLTKAHYLSPLTVDHNGKK